jgi:peptidyl-prolyl cis-trans isomerase A (cyclophilin A)
MPQRPRRTPLAVAAAALTFAATGAAPIGALADTTPTANAPPGATAAGGGEDPVPNHVFPLAEAVKGVKGQGPLVAKIDVEQAGKPLGSFTCELFEKEAPNAVANFVGLARGLRPFKDPSSGQWVKRPFYDGLQFHRVIPDFMIQGGDPKGSGAGDPGYAFPDEIPPSLSFDKPGMLAMANRGAGTGTQGSQFFITERPTPWLNGKHTIFGRCEPVELVAKIAAVPKGVRDRPAEPVVMKRVTISRGAVGKTGKTR